MVSEKTRCSSWLRVNQYKHVCSISLSFDLFNFSLIFVNWYKQPIVSAKQLIVFLVLCLFALCFWQTDFLIKFSQSDLILCLKVCENPF